MEPPIQLSVSEAKARFAEAIRAAERGEVVEITRHGKVVATLRLPVPKRKPAQRVGPMKGEFWMADDFDELVPEWDEYVKPRDILPILM